MFIGTSRHLFSPSGGLTSVLPTNGDLPQRYQNGAADIDFRHLPLPPALRLYGALDEESFSTRSSPVHRPTNATSDFAMVRQIPRQVMAGNHHGEERTTAGVLPFPVSSWSRSDGDRSWWAGRRCGQWVDEEERDFDNHRSATVGRRRLMRTTALVEEDSDMVDHLTGLSHSTACLIEARCDGRTPPVTVAISPNS